MNSFATRDDSLALVRAALERQEQGARHARPGLAAMGTTQPIDTSAALPLDFVQHRVPKIRCSDLHPIEWPQQPALAWCPPGHGDLYTALVTSGLLQRLLEQGYQTLFVSNADNLGAALDARILGHMLRERLPFLMEVTPRTPADRKGGHLARRHDGQLLLREGAQCPPDDIAAFQDIERHRYFNTNNLWLNLQALAARLASGGGTLELPLICNRKTVDPRDPSSPAVFQLETAMGSAIELFEGAAALVVPRSRFSPVKTTSDLLAVRSDAYLLTDDGRIVLHPQRGQHGPPRIDLDPACYTKVDDLEQRFTQGPPSLLACSSLRVRGDVRFGAEVTVRGEVTLEAPAGEVLHVPSGSVLQGR